MSADNYLAIRKEKDGKFRAYDLSASCHYNDKMCKHSVFEANTIEEAVRKAQQYCWDNIVEYGYNFINLIIPKNKKGARK
jgi:hypothetical protein